MKLLQGTLSPVPKPWDPSIVGPSDAIGRIGATNTRARILPRRKYRHLITDPSIIRRGLPQAITVRQDIAPAVLVDAVDRHRDHSSICRRVDDALQMLEHMRTKDFHQIHTRTAHIGGRIGGEVGIGEKGGELSGFVGGGFEDGLGGRLKVGGVCDVLQAMILASLLQQSRTSLLDIAMLRKSSTVWTSLSHWLIEASIWISEGFVTEGRRQAV